MNGFCKIKVKDLALDSSHAINVSMNMLLLFYLSFSNKTVEDNTKEKGRERDYGLLLLFFTSSNVFYTALHIKIILQDKDIFVTPLTTLR